MYEIALQLDSKTGKNYAKLFYRKDKVVEIMHNIRTNPGKEVRKLIRVGDCANNAKVFQILIDLLQDAISSNGV